MNKKNLVTVLVPTHKRADALADTLTCLRDQRRDSNYDYEVIVIDNGSDIETKEIVNKYVPAFEGKIRYISEPKKGKSNALNAGIEEAGGDIIAITDDDCMPEKEWIYKIWQQFNKDKSIDVLLGGVIWEDGVPFYTKDYLFRGNGANSSFRKQLFKEIGSFDNIFGPGSMGYSAEDIEFIYRAYKNSKNIVICNDIIVHHKQRIDDSDEYKKRYRDVKGCMICWLKYGLMRKDAYSLKRMYWFVSGVLSELFAALKNNDRGRVRLKLLQLTGILVGFVKGMYIWLLYVPIKSICQKSA